jgi:hypothetical protein
MVVFTPGANKVKVMSFPYMMHGGAVEDWLHATVPISVAPVPIVLMPGTPTSTDPVASGTQPLPTSGNTGEPATTPHAKHVTLGGTPSVVTGLVAA